jgi:proteasome lid subunit RPN8/RPN11
MTELRKAAERALPAETGGLLAGRIFRDEAGPYTVLLGFAEAPLGAGSPGQFVMSPQDTYLLKEQLARAEPACDVVGWHHSHSRPMLYSSVDLANQRLWSDPQQVGVLVYASGDEFGVVYQGPNSKLLKQLPRPDQGARPVEPQARLAIEGPANVSPPPESRRRAAKPVQDRALSLLTLLVAIAVLVVVLVTGRESRTVYVTPTNRSAASASAVMPLDPSLSPKLLPTEALTLSPAPSARWSGAPSAIPIGTPSLSPTPTDASPSNMHARRTQG